MMVVCLIVATAAAFPLFNTPTSPLTEVQAQGLFVEFIKRYGKTYAVDDFFNRFNIFKENVEWIINWNSDKSNTHQCGVNFFADLSESEWPRYKGLTMPGNWKEPDYTAMDNVKDEDDKMLQLIRKERGLSSIPDAFDWVEQGKLEPIRNQVCFSIKIFNVVFSFEFTSLHISLSTHYYIYFTLSFY